MNLYGLVGLLAFAVLAFAVRWQFNRTSEDVMSADRSNVFPVSTPFESSLCNAANNYCRNLDLDSDFELP